LQSSILVFGSLTRAGEADEFDVEVEFGVGGDGAATALFTVAEGRGDDECALLADGHAGDALVPALDDFALAEGEADGFAALAGVIEFLPILESADVVDPDDVTGLGGGIAGRGFDDAEAGLGDGLLSGGLRGRGGSGLGSRLGMRGEREEGSGG